MLRFVTLDTLSGFLLLRVKAGKPIIYKHLWVVGTIYAPILWTEFRQPFERWCHRYKALGNQGWIFPSYAPGPNAEKYVP